MSEKRSNATHESLTDRFARLFKKTRGAEAKLCYLGHLVTENRNGLVVDTRLTLATWTAEREAAIAVAEQMAERNQQATLGADRAYDTRDFVGKMRELRITARGAEHIQPAQRD